MGQHHRAITDGEGKEHMGPEGVRRSTDDEQSDVRRNGRPGRANVAHVNG
jgi:hypothetical protein